MVGFTNEKSLKDTYGDREASGLLADVPGSEQADRLEKASLSARADIEDYLRSGGYVVPLIFTPYGDALPVGDVPPYIPANIQAISDCFTAWYLAATEDLSKKKYDECRAAGLAWLKLIADGTLILEPIGTDAITVLSRPRVFDRYNRAQSNPLRSYYYWLGDP
jgi:hypothetical protein